MTRDNIDTSLNIRVADWQHDRDELSLIRQKVFVKEQNVPVDMEWDEHDAVSTHYLVTLDDKPVATARLKPDGQIGRMAVLAEFRNQGIGNQLLKFVLKNATEKNHKNFYLHAQVTAITFYEKHGFISHGEVFYEASIAHREMHLKT